MKKEMSKRCLKALKGSIKKWEKISDGDWDKGPVNCPLCVLYYKSNCRSCPVRKKVGLCWCGGTPYADWHVHHLCHPGVLGRKKIQPRCTTCKELAHEELHFLESLLPRTKK